FQEEDGIRDSSVTGVQTCALPICQRSAGPWLKSMAEVEPPDDLVTNILLRTSGVLTRQRAGQRVTTSWMDRAGELASAIFSPVEIGRGTCRERVYGCGVVRVLSRE